MESLQQLSILVLASAIFFLVRLVKWKSQSSKLPPGPRMYPIIGCLLDLPSSLDSAHLAKLGKEYNSDIVHLGALGKSIMILNSYEAAKDLLEKRSGIYSSRNAFVMVSELCGWNYLFSLFPYGDRWRNARRSMTKHVGTDSARLHQPKELQNARRLLTHLLQSPEKFIDHIRHMVGSNIISTTYGIRVQEFDDPFVKLAEDAANHISPIAVTQTILEYFPILQHVPAWVPGAWFRDVAKVSQVFARDLRNKPFNAAKELFRSGQCLPSYVSSGLEEIEKHNGTQDEIEALGDVAATMYLAGADTTAATIENLLLAMIKWPEIQKKVQEELDRVVQGRLPHQDDFPSLPYLYAAVLETYRWKPTTPVGVPHTSVLDDVYRGYLIPKGSTLVVNQKNMLYNEEIYPEPHIFRPERFLKDGKINPEIRNPMDIGFGFGRRSCPGRHIAHSTVMITAASVLSTFDLFKPRDAQGNEVEPREEYVEGLASHPLPFESIIKPRSTSAHDLIDEWAASGKEDL